MNAAATTGMNQPIRTGFEVKRKRKLDQENDRGIILNAASAERLVMVWPMLIGFDHGCAT